MKIPKDQIEEWFDNPVTQLLVKYLTERVEIAYESRADFFVAENADLTHTQRAIFVGNEQAYVEILDALREKDVSMFEEGEEVESIRNIPDGRPRTN